MKKKQKAASVNPDLQRAVKKLLETPLMTFEQMKSAIETAIKFETLKLRSQGDETGKFFNDDDLAGGDDDDTF